jgi:ABC-type sugar transport system substrate-binding protein
MLQTVSKALAGAAAAGVGSLATLIVVPPEAQMPWWGYVVVGVLNAALGLGVVYFAPKNRG